MAQGPLKSEWLRPINSNLDAAIGSGEPRARGRKFESRTDGGGLEELAAGTDST